MKKFSVVILSVLLIFVLLACNKEVKDNESSIGDALQDTATKSDVSTENKSDNADENNALDSSQSNSNDNTNQSAQENSSQSNANTPSDSTATNNNNTNQSTQENSSQSNAETPSGSTATNNNNTNQSTQENSSQSNAETPSGSTATNNNNTNQSTQENSSQSNADTPSGSTATNNNNTNQSTQENSSQSNAETPSGSTATNNNNTNQSTQENSSQSNADTPSGSTATNNNTYENIDNGVLEKVSSEKMNVPENMELLGTNNAKEENNSKNIKANVALYQLDGDVVNWMIENDLLYVITSGNNRLVVINEKTMMAVANIPLAGSPAEINLVGDEIYISLPDLCRIDIFSKSTFDKISSLYFEHEISSFCIDGNYIYYSSHDQHCEAYKKDLTTNELTRILPDRGWTFYQPKLYLNKQDNILYIGETGTTGSTLFYYDATTLQIKSLFRKNNYGMMNHTKDIFHVEDEIFWGNYRLSDTNANQIIGRYGEVDYGSVNFASKELVSTFEGVFLTDTYECIINYFDAQFDFEYVLVSESYNFFFRSRDVDKNIIIGVNFSMQ